MFLALPLALTAATTSVSVAMLLICLSVFTAGGFQMVALKVGTLTYPREQAAMMSGIASGAWSLCNALLSPQLGKLLDARRSTRCLGSLRFVRSSVSRLARADATESRAASDGDHLGRSHIRRPTMTDLHDRMSIRELIENWALWRDAREWDRFRTVWHDDGVMMATWSQGTADEFIARSQAGFEKGIRILHELGGTTVDVREVRAIAQTRMTIHQRAQVHGIECDVACIGRFYDFFEKRAGRWGLVLGSPSTRSIG